MTEETHEYLDYFQRLAVIAKNQAEQNNPILGASESTELVPLENRLPYVKYQEPARTVEPEHVIDVFNRLHSITTNEMKQLLKKVYLPFQGDRRQLRKTLRDFYRTEYVKVYKEKELEAGHVANKTLKHFEFLVVIDFECTCKEVIYDYPHEIIEFPAVLIDVAKMKIVDTFRTYVRPVINPELDPFCIDFCNITQNMVDMAPLFSEALNTFQCWMHKHRLGEQGRRYCFVTDGPHDIWKFFQFQCIQSGFEEVPHQWRYWCNIQKIFESTTGHKLIRRAGGAPKLRITSLQQMLKHYGMEAEGFAHTGIDDSINIAKVAIQLMRMDHAEIRINEKMCYTEEISNKKKGENQETTDIHVWKAKLKLKLRRVRRDDFISRSYLDCESCDDD